MTVSQAASKYRRLNNPGSYSGPWDNTLAPYMVEPMDELTNPSLKAFVFVGPAQSGKTDSLLLNWLTYSVRCDPMDLIMYSPSMAAARDFSIRRVDRLHRHSPEVGERVRKDRDADNKFDKQYVNGMLLSLSWPSSTEMAGKPIPRVALTDNDRMEDNIDGEGSPFDLASKRTTTFGSFAMTLAESSPSRSLEDPRWISNTPHEAPPTTGKATEFQANKLVKLATAAERNESTLAKQRTDQQALAVALREAGIEISNLADAETQARQAAATLGITINKTQEAIANYADNVRQARIENTKLADNAAFQQKLDEAAKLNKAGEYVRFWQNALRDADVTEQQLAVSNALRKTADEALATARGYKTLGTAAKSLQGGTGLRDMVNGIVNPGEEARKTLAGVEAER